MVDINDIITKGEGALVEAKKSSKGLPDNLWESYSAFANTNGGIILLGVSEVDKKLVVSGVSDAQDKIKMLWNNLNNQQKVNLNILVERQVYIQTIDGKEIIVIEVPRADRRDKPIYINNDLQKGVYRRNADGDYHCSLPDIKAMLRDQSDIASDSRLIDELLLSDLDKDTIVGYRNHFASLKPAHIWNRLDNESFLHKIGAARRSGSSVLKPTLAGLLMFGTEDIITQILPDYFLDYREINDSRRWSDRVVSNLGEWSGNIFDFFFKIVNRLTADIKRPFRMRNHLEREDDTAVHHAIREALANALIHADYYGRQGIVIEKRPRKIVFANPGIFRPDKDEVFGGGISDPRNPNIFKMFALIDIGERAGSGLFNICTVWQNIGWSEPVWEEKFTPERLILSIPIEIEEDRAQKDTVKVLEKVGEKITTNQPETVTYTTDQKTSTTVMEDVSKTDQKTDQKTNMLDNIILSLIKENTQISITEIAQKIERGLTATKERISKLKAKGLLERIGPDKGGYWKVIEKNY